MMSDCVSRAIAKGNGVTVADDVETTRWRGVLQWSGDDASACRDESVGVSLNAASSADVRSQSNVQRVRDAVLASEALTVELWLRPHTVSTAGQETSLLAFGEWPVGSVLNRGSCDGCDLRLAVWHGAAQRQ